MHDITRKKRPPPERTEPIRASTTNDGAKNREPADHESRQAPPSVDEGEANGAREASYKAINNAYRLIDDYLRQGQKMAENLWIPSETAERVDDGASAAPLRFMRAMGDMTMAWVEVMQKWTSEAGSPAGGAGPFTAGRVPSEGATAPSAPPKAAERARSLKVSVKSRGRIDVTVHVGDLANLPSLTPTELRSFAGEAPPIRDVKLDVGTAEEPAVLRIEVPDDQPPGTYNGLLVDQGTHQPRGTISLSIA